MMKMKTTVRKEFLIDDAVCPSGQYDDLVTMLGELATTLAGLEPPVPPSGPRLDLHAVAAIATGVWRLENNMLQPDSDKPRDEMKRVYRHLATVKELLEEMGVVIRNHTGEVIPERGVYQIEKIEEVVKPGLTRRTVIETVKPSVFYHQERIQMGQVIIGIPSTLPAH